MFINHVSKHFLDKRQVTEALTSLIKNLVTFQTCMEKDILTNSRTLVGTREPQSDWRETRKEEMERK